MENLELRMKEIRTDFPDAMAYALLQFYAIANMWAFYLCDYGKDFAGGQMCYAHTHHICNIFIIYNNCAESFIFHLQTMFSTFWCKNKT